MGRKSGQPRNERRVGPRRLVQGDACLFDETGEPFLLAMHDVSPGGMFVQSDVLLSWGDELWISFGLPGSPKLVVRGRVARVQLGPDALPGMGIVFVDLTPREESWLWLFVHGEGDDDRIWALPGTPALQLDHSTSSPAALP